MSELDIMRQKVEHIRKQYPSFTASISVPENVQMFVFYAPLKNIDAPDLCGIIFPKEDYSKASARMVMYGLNKVDKPTQYVGVDFEFRHPLAVLEFGLENLVKSPQKILYDSGQYFFTRKKMLSDPMNMTNITVVFTELVEVFNPLVVNAGELKKLAQKLVDAKVPKRT